MPEISVTSDKVLIDGKKHIDLPIGTIIMNAGNNGSSSFGSAFLLCDGSSKSVSAYPELSAVLNFKYGGSSGSGSFNLPDFLDRFPIGLLTVNGTNIPDDPDTSTKRQGGSSIIKTTQFSHVHSSVNPVISGINGITPRGNIDDESPRSDTLVSAQSYPDIITTDSGAPPHIPPYYPLNYFIYSGKGVIG
jgi:microcystin-dependent protein